MQYVLAIFLVVVVMLLIGCATSADGEVTMQPDEASFHENLERAAECLKSKYDPEIRLLADAQSPGGLEARGKFWMFDQIYHTADNRLASMALEP